MATVNVAKGQKIWKRGDKLKHMAIVLQGSVEQISKTDRWTVESGSMLGIMEAMKGIITCDYVAKEDSSLYMFNYQQPKDFRAIFQAQPKYAYIFVSAAVKQAAMLMERYESLAKRVRETYMFCSRIYQEYGELCAQYGIEGRNFAAMENAQAFASAVDQSPWQVDYYKGMSKMSLNKIQQFYGTDHGMCIGEIMNAANCMFQGAKVIDELYDYVEDHKGILFNAEGNDLLGLYFDLQCTCARKGLDQQLVRDKLEEIKEELHKEAIFDQIQLEERLAEYDNYDYSAPQETDDAMEDIASIDCFTKILTYAYFEADRITAAKEVLEQYKGLQDKLSTSDDVRKMRRELTNIFFEAYEVIFRRSLDEKKIPSIIRMFLNFGFMDVELVGEENARTLQRLTSRLAMFRSDNVYTIYEWIKSIQEGKNEPSKNEFDVDYAGHLAELRKSGEIDKKKQEEMMNDISAKVDFELKNMFRSNSRITYGKYSTYCPLLADYDIINSVENMIVTVEKLEEALNEIRKIDYSLFYREVVFSDPDHEINREFIQKEVLPNIILVPNVGTKAMMWQETAGTKRDTAARIIFPIMTSGNISDMMSENAGRFRWEMCRKIQGMRWNDIRERSLTSEYCDYIQFYRKNHDLSTEAKEKLKNALTKAKNNYREVFVKDYQSWLKFEANGSFRLNKVARDIMFRYCPFSKEIRSSLGINPMYQEMFNKFEILKERKMRHVENVYSKYQQAGGEITAELQENLDYYQL